MAEPRRKLDILAAPTALAGVGLWLARAALLARLGDEPLARLWVERVSDP